MMSTTDPWAEPPPPPPWPAPHVFAADGLCDNCGVHILDVIGLCLGPPRRLPPLPPSWPADRDRT